MRHAIVDDTRDSDDTRAVFTSIFYNRKAGFSKTLHTKENLAMSVLGEKTKRTGKEKKSDSSKKKKKKEKLILSEAIAVFFPPKPQSCW